MWDSKSSLTLTGSDVLVNVNKRPWEKKKEQPWLVMFANFSGVPTPMVKFKLPTWYHWAQIWAEIWGSTSFIIQHFCHSDMIIVNDLENTDNSKNNLEVRVLVILPLFFSNEVQLLFSVCNLTVVFNHWRELVKVNSKILTTGKAFGYFTVQVSNGFDFGESNELLGKWK